MVFQIVDEVAVIVLLLYKRLRVNVRIEESSGSLEDVDMSATYTQLLPT